MKLVRALRGRDVKRTYGLAETMEQLSHESEAFRVEVAKFLDGLVSHLVFDDGKPLNFIAEGRRGVTQPAIKCRGPEYLRIIYGPEYLLPANLERLRSRNVGAKRSLASREFALGVEALERFVRKEPLRRTHECVFGVLALESEPVDPRL